MFDSTFGRPLPTTVGSYRVVSCLSVSGMYADYQVEHEHLGHRLMLRHERWPSREDGDLDVPAAFEALKRARRLQSEVRHHGILPTIDFFEEEGEWFSVFFEEPETVSLSTVCESIRGGARPQFKLSEFLALGQDLTDALAAIHQRDFVHRTISPSNVLLDRSSRAMFADLGCATPAEFEDTASRAFRRIFAPLTAAPEQITSEKPLTKAADIWSLGIVLFLTFYNKHPFLSSTDDKPLGWAHLTVDQEIMFPDPSTGAESTHCELLYPWFARMLQRDPGKRPKDATEVRRDLQAIRARLEDRPAVAKAFVAMPFSKDLDDLWRAIEAICLECRVSPVRVDETIAYENIWDEICVAVEGSDLLIGVVSPGETVANPNVMLEIGYMRALKRPIIILTGDTATLPFDLRTHRAVLCPADAANNAEFHAKLSSLLRKIVHRSHPTDVAE